MKQSDYTYIQYTTYNREMQKSGRRRKGKMRKEALKIEVFTKHTKEFRHEDRVQQDDSVWLLCSQVASTEEALHGQLFTHTLKNVAWGLHVYHLKKGSGNSRLAWPFSFFDHDTQHNTTTNTCQDQESTVHGLTEVQGMVFLATKRRWGEKETILEKLVLTSVQRHRGCGCIQLPHDCIWFYSSGESRSNTKLLQFRWVCTERTRPHIQTHSI